MTNLETKRKVEAALIAVPGVVAMVGVGCTALALAGEVALTAPVSSSARTVVEVVSPLVQNLNLVLMVGVARLVTEYSRESQIVLETGLLTSVAAFLARLLKDN